MSSDREMLCEGRHLIFWRARGWEYVEHRRARQAVMVVAITADESLVLVEEFRPSVNASVISLPAGLVGDGGPEPPPEAALRELREETGFEATTLQFLMRGPGSAGATSEIVHFFLARDVRLAGERSMEDKEQIRVHVVPLARIFAWVGEKERAGLLIDPKLWAGVYLAGQAAAPKG